MPPELDELLDDVDEELDELDVELEEELALDDELPELDELDVEDPDELVELAPPDEELPVEPLLELDEVISVCSLGAAEQPTTSARVKRETRSVFMAFDCLTKGGLVGAVVQR